MECPERMPRTEDKCLLLLKTIYGLVQSSRMFNKFWNNILKSMGFNQSAADPCLFVKGKGADIILICIYVDDGCALGSKNNLLKFFEELKKHVTITVEESIKDYLSCEIVFNKDLTCAWLGQPHMVKKIIKTFGDQAKKLPTYRTPGTPDFCIVKSKDEEPTVSVQKHTEYRSGVGMLLYLVKHSRPDLHNPIRELTKCLDKPTPAAYKEMMRIIKYVLQTQTLGLKIMPQVIKDTLTWNLLLWSDSDWAGDKDNRRSISGMSLFVCGTCVAWRSKQQKTVALSSSEVEFIAVSL